MQDFEKLGVFYLGRVYDLAKKKAQDDLVLYDSKDMVTHAVCVGMTGSGKTGLCLTVLEEAAIDGIPVIAIDPKGDVANLLLTFPNLSGPEFAPWINPDDARKAGVPPEEFAAKQAETWKKGLEGWGQDGTRIQRLRDAAEFVVYTPGSNAGLPVAVLRSFSPPEKAILEDAELFRERVNTTVTSLLALAGIEADPVQSREHILIATILSTAWKQGQGLDLPALIQQIQKPPVTQIGVLDLESFFPAKQRFELAMTLNNLLASPGFEAWLKGEPLHIDSLLHSKSGKPRICIFSIAHLSDAERMFFVALLLNQVLGWMRTQPGTGSLRAMVYMDEIFGYFPPIANPPSKAPLLTLLKQARAFGVGVMLATQNPVDLDYKGLANCGTWFLGRLQTERDKARVLDGLAGAASTKAFDRQGMEQILSGLGNRIFLMHNVHEDAPVVFQVRWALSYLSGPLTRTQIKTLMDEYRKNNPDAAAATTAAAALPTQVGGAALTSQPLLPPDVPHFFVPQRGAAPAGVKLLYRPMLFGCGEVYVNDTKNAIENKQAVGMLAELAGDTTTIDWEAAQPVEWSDSDLEKDGEGEAVFETVPAPAAKPKSYDAWKKSLATTIYRTKKIELLRSPTLELVSKPGESERDFRVRLQQAAREERDQRAEQFRKKLAPKLATLEERIRRAQQTVDKESSQATQSKIHTFISFGMTVLSGLLGRKKFSVTNVGKAAGAARDVGKSMKESQDVARATETVEALKKQQANLEAECEADLAALDAKTDPQTEKLDAVVIKPKKTDITVQLVALVWTPHWLQPDGTAKPAWE